MMVISLSLDEALAKLWYALKPNFNLTSMSEPYAISQAHNFTKTDMATFSNWLEGN